MATHIEEQEQIDAIKKWWSQNWSTVVFPLLAIVIGYGGWSLWQDHRANQAQQGSDAYEALLVKLENNANPNQEQRVEIQAIAQSLAEEQKGSLYGNYARLLLAKLAVEEGDLEQAADVLAAVVDNSANEATQHIALSRLARVQLALQQYDVALASADKATDSTFSAVFDELRGDVFSAQNKRAEAVAAYTQAMANLSPNQFAKRNILQIKLDNVQVLAEEKPDIIPTDPKLEATDTPAGEPVSQNEVTP